MYHEWCSITSKWAHFKILANSVWAIFLFLPLCYVKIPSNWQPYKGPSSPHTVNMKLLYCTGIVRHFDPLTLCIVQGGWGWRGSGAELTKIELQHGAATLTPPLGSDCQHSWHVQSLWHFYKQRTEDPTRNTTQITFLSGYIFSILYF